MEPALSAPRIRSGTSGYSYKEWKGSFYPADLAAGRMLGYYAERLSTVEINNTFYRMPSEKLLAGWCAQVPEDFSLVLKAPGSITHKMKLRGASDQLGLLLQTASTLGGRRGPMLFQLPPYLKCDVPLLRDFLALFPPSSRAAFEFRSSGWFAEPTYDALREHGAALVVSDREDAEEPPVVPTANFGYLRLRRPAYDERALAQWLARIAGQPWDEAHVFFKHEDEGIAAKLALEFGALSSAKGSGT